MKKILFVLFLFVNVSLIAQNSGRGFNYQAVARDAEGLIRRSELIEIRFSLLQNSSTGVADWIETHSINTDAFGTFSVIVGKGTRDANSAYTNFEDLNFRKYSYWLKIEIQDGGSWLELSNQQLLSVPYAENTVSLPVGTILPYAGNFSAALADQGWMLCNGEAISRTDYEDLFTAIGTAWGEGDASTTFNLPALGGLFLRGVDDNFDGTSNDPDKDTRTTINPGGNTGNNVGSYQVDAFQSHRHSVPTRAWGSGAGGGGQYPDAAGDISGSPEDDGNGTPSLSTETRPKNAYVNYIIKVK